MRREKDLKEGGCIEETDQAQMGVLGLTPLKALRKF